MSINIAFAKGKGETSSHIVAYVEVFIFEKVYRIFFNMFPDQFNMLLKPCVIEVMALLSGFDASIFPKHVFFLKITN